MQTNYDSPWKMILERHFQQMVEFMLPEIAEDIDWSFKPQFLDKELLAIQKGTEVGKKLADKLIKVCKKEGQKIWVILHIEIQGSKEANFAERIYQYYFRIYEKYNVPTMCLAILTDPNNNWRPTQYQRALWGCKSTLEFPIIKLLDYANRQEELALSKNPIAKVIEAHLAALNSRGHAGLKFENKLRMTKSLYHLGYTREDVQGLYVFIDYILQLPEELEHEFIMVMKKYEEEVNMQYISSAQRLGRKEGIEIGLKQGIEQGIEQGIQRGIGQGIEQGIGQGTRFGECKFLRILLEQKFGPLSENDVNLLEQATTDELEKMAQKVLNAKSIKDVLI